MTTDITITLDDDEVTALARIRPDGITECLSNDGYNPEVIALVTKALTAVQPRYIPQPGDLFRLDNGSTTTWRVIQPTSSLVLTLLETGEVYDEGTLFCVDSSGWFEPFGPGELRTYTFVKISTEVD